MSWSLFEGIGERRYQVLRGIGPESLAEERQIVRTISFKSQHLPH